MAEEKKVINLSEVIHMFESGHTRTEIIKHYNLTSLVAQELFKHPKLQGLRKKEKKIIEIIDDIGDIDEEVRKEEVIDDIDKEIEKEIGELEKEIQEDVAIKEIKPPEYFEFNDLHHHNLYENLCHGRTKAVEYIQLITSLDKYQAHKFVDDYTNTAKNIGRSNIRLKDIESRLLHDMGLSTTQRIQQPELVVDLDLLNKELEEVEDNINSTITEEDEMLMKHLEETEQLKKHLKQQQEEESSITINQDDQIMNDFPKKPMVTIKKGRDLMLN